MSKYTKNVGKDKGGLHFKLVTDTTETKKYAKDVGKNAPTVMNNFLLEQMTVAMEETRAYLKGVRYTKNATGPTRWAVKGGSKGLGMAESTQTATKKIADSLVVRKTRDANVDKSTASVSMWSQDPENPNNFTGAGVRGSRARSGKKYAGKIAQYYEGGKSGFAYGVNSSRQHDGFRKLAYMARAQKKVDIKWRTNIGAYLENNLGPGGEVIEQSTSSYKHVTNRDITKMMKLV